MFAAACSESSLLFVFQVSANGNVLRSEIVGSIKMRVFLSGMPELRLGLNDKVLFENTGREFSTLSDTILCKLTLQNCVTSLFTLQEGTIRLLFLSDIRFSPCIATLTMA